MPDINSQVPDGGIPLAPPGLAPGPVPGTPQPGPTVAPVSPPSIGAQAMATPEQMQELRDILNGVKTKISESETAQFVGQNTTDSAKKDALREMFTLLQSAGVDLTDPQSVGSFLASMREKNPQLAEDFEATLNQLLGIADPAPQEPIPETPEPFGDLGPPNLNNEINNEAISEDIRGPLPPGPPGGQLG